MRTVPRDLHHQLLVLAFGCGFLWRLEVELGGWAGLQWIDYQHAAIPVCLCGFLMWLWLALARNTSLKLQTVAVAGIWLVIGGLTLRMLAEAYFGGPDYLWKPLLELIFKDYSNENFKRGWELYARFRWLAAVAWGLFPLPLYFAYSCLLGYSKKSWIKPLTLWCGAWHLGLLVIAIIPEKGSLDLIHSLKTGWMIPFAVFALGWPVASIESKKTNP